MKNKSVLQQSIILFYCYQVSYSCNKLNASFLTVSVSRFSLVEKVLNVMLIARPFGAVIIHWQKVLVGYSSGKFGESIDVGS